VGPQAIGFAGELIGQSAGSFADREQTRAGLGSWFTTGRRRRG
jgi:hypothetical protein